MKSKANSIKLWFYAAIIILLAILTGYLRDSIFKTINALLRSWDLDQDYFLPPFLSFLENYEYETLENLKWLLTLLFSLIYLLISIGAIKLFFNNSKYIKIAIFTYIGIIFISGIFILIGLVFSSTTLKMYEFSRYLMGMAQSPIVLMILIPTFKLSEKEKFKTSKE